MKVILITVFTVFVLSVAMEVYDQGGITVEKDYAITMLSHRIITELSAVFVNCYQESTGEEGAAGCSGPAMKILTG